MAATLTSRINLQLSAALQNTVGLQDAAAPLSITKTVDLANGTGANQADKIFSAQYSIGTGATQSIDLQAALTDGLGAAFTPAKVKAIYIGSSAANTTALTLFGDAAHVPFLGTVATTMALRPGGCFLLVNPDATGTAVTATTGDIVKIVNAAGATAVVDVVIIGTSA